MLLLRAPRCSDDGESAPWGTKWFGLGAGKGGGQAWFHNFKIPFGTSIRVTTQAATAHGGFYMIVRGALDVPLVIGDVTLPSAARLQLQAFDGPLKPLDFLDIVSVPKGHEGQFFMSTLSVNNSGVGVNFLEGCYHMYVCRRAAPLGAYRHTLPMRPRRRLRCLVAVPQHGAKPPLLHGYQAMLLCTGYPGSVP